jgi:hypothetical protein
MNVLTVSFDFSLTIVAFHVVICQRQMQKGALAALAVDKVKQAKGNNGLNPQELQDCFALKESCSCDTKRKVANWPDYSKFRVLIVIFCKQYFV